MAATSKTAHIPPHHRVHQTPAYVTQFIAKLLPIARDVKKNWGVPIAVLIAQGAQETGWGRHVVGNAYFGIKGHSPSGASVDFTTHEVVGKQSVAITDTFRAYDSLADAADDYGRFLKTNPGYASCFAYSDNPDQFVDHLAAAGYATDPNYAAELKSIIRVHQLAEYDRPPAKP
jgi:flagellum-specific peptidoglycan hydrolase FlgJ